MPEAQPAISDQAMIALRDCNQSNRQIAVIAKVHHQTVARILKRLTPRNSTELYKNHRADILAEMQRKFLRFVDTAAIKKMIASRGLTDFGIIYDKERIERGQNDSNIKPMVTINVVGSAQVHVDKPVDRITANHIKGIEG